jgi:hypothetical protein
LLCTWWQALLELLGLLRILEDQSVEVSFAPNLELRLVRTGALLYPSGYEAMVSLARTIGNDRRGAYKRHPSFGRFRETAQAS